MIAPFLLRSNRTNRTQNQKDVNKQPNEQVGVSESPIRVIDR